MPNDVVGDILRVTVAWQYPDAQILENNIGYLCAVTGGTDTRAGLGAAVIAIFATNWIPRMAPAAGLYGAKISSVNKVPPPLPVTVASGAPGTGANPGCPTQARPIIRFTSASTGRKYRGRLFLPSPQTADVNAAGFPGVACQAAMTALYTALIAPITVAGSTWNPVIIHRVKGQPLLTTTTLITGGANSGKFGTQWKSGNTGRVNVTPW